MPDWTLAEDAAQTTAEATALLTEDLAAQQQLVGLLREAYADLESLYRDDIGWRRVGEQATAFTNDGRRRMAAIADLNVTGNALIKRGVKLRIGYIWGEGVQVTVRDDGGTGQDVNAVLQAFWDEPSNRRAFTSSEAQSRYERRLATTGEAFWALPTDRVTGRVWVRRLPPAEIVDRVCDPEDAETVWLYKRTYTAVLPTTTGERRTEQRTTYYPALGFSPAVRPRTYLGDEIRWDAPVRHVAVNCPDEDWRGVGDVLPAMPWARMDKEFLEDLAVYMRALTRILGQVSGPSGKAAAAAAAAIAASTAGPGGWAATDPNTSMSLMSKSGAQIDAQSHRPLATMVASALEVPLTMLLSDPGVTGARATAETLDQPTENMARERRGVHAELFRDIADHVIDMAVVAPGGPLVGTVARDRDRLVVSLPEIDDRTVQVRWPEFDSTPLKDLVAAVVDADGTGKLPPLETFRLLAHAFGIENLDALLDELTDDDGRWLDPQDQQAVDEARRGRAGTDAASTATYG